MKNIVIAVGLTLCALSLHGQQRFVKTVNNIADLVALRPFDIHTNVFVAGYYTADDGGQGIFTYDSASAIATNYGTRLKPANFDGRWIRQFSGALNVRWFGAKGDSVADDTPRIQDALDRAIISANTLNSRQGVEVYIPPGGYNVTSLTVYDGTTIIGSTRGEVLLFKTSTTGDLFTLTATNAGILNAVSFENLKIIQNGVATSGAGIRLRANSSAPAIAPTIRNVYIYSTFYGVQMSNIISGTLDNVTVQGVVSHGFFTEYPINGLSLRSCYASSCGGDGYRFFGNYSTLVNCASDGNAIGYNFYKDAAGRVNTTIAMMGCGAEENRTRGVHATEAVSLAIHNLYLLGDTASTDGIRLDGGRSIVLDNCYITPEGADVGYAVRLVNTSSGSYPQQVLVNGGIATTFSLGFLLDPGGNVTRIADDNGRLSVGNGWNSDYQLGVRGNGKFTNSTDVAVRLHGGTTIWDMNAIAANGRFIISDDALVTRFQLEKTAAAFPTQTDFSVNTSDLKILGGRVGINKAAPLRELDVGGGFRFSGLLDINRTGLSDNYVATTNDCYMSMSVNAKTITLPAVSTTVGGHLVWVKSNGAGVTTTVAPNGLDTIDNVAASDSVAPNGSTIYVSNGVANWEKK